MVVGLISSGEMGAAIGARLVGGGIRVVTSTEGRSDRTVARAAEAGIERCDGLDTVVSLADVCLSVVPPGEAFGVASEVAAACARVGAEPLVVDLNAIAPTTLGRVARALSRLELVDGAISGPPPRVATTTRIYLAGAKGEAVAELLSVAAVTVVVGSEPGLASAVKMCTASVYKGRVALLAQALRTADSHGVVGHVLADLVSTGLADPDRTGQTLARACAKAWRYVPEMHEIASTQAAAGLSAELFEALARVYGELAESTQPALAPGDVPADIELASVLRSLRTSD